MARQPIVASPAVRKKALSALQELRSQEAQVVIRGPGGSVRLPREAVELLVTLLEQLASGTEVAIFPSHAELTTQQAANALNVSRPYLISLLDSGMIRFRKVGTHRRVPVQALIEYKRRRDAEARQILDELTREAQEPGLGY